MRLIKTTMCDERWRLAAFRSGRFLTIKGMKAAFLFFGVALLFFYHQPLLFYLFKQLLKNFIKCSKILKSEIAQNRTA